MAEFVLLPETFVRYVSTYRRLPLPPDADLDTFRSLIELVTLEAAVASGEAPSPPVIS
jgi:hypothetical protein